MVQHLRNAAHNLVASELLLGTRCYQAACIGSAFFYAFLLYIFVLNEFVVEDLFLYHLLVVQSVHHFLKPLLLRLCRSRNRINLERFQYSKGQFFHSLSRFTGESLMSKVEELADASHHIGLVAVAGRQVYGFLVDSHHFFALFHGLCVTLLLLRQCLHRSQIVFRHLLTSIGTCRLSFCGRFQFHVANVDAIDKEHDIRANRIKLCFAYFERMTRLLHSTEDVLLELFVSFQLCSRDIEQPNLFTFEGYGLVTIDVDSHILSIQKGLFYLVLQGILQGFFVITKLL